MPATTIADLYLPAAVSPVLQARLYDRSTLMAFGAAVRDPMDLAMQGGNTVVLRQSDVVTSSAFADDSTARTPVGPTMRAVVAPILRRWFLLGLNQRIKEALGTDNAEVVNEEILNQATPMWTREMRTAMLKALIGATDTSTGCLLSTNVHIVNTAKGDGKANFNAVADARAKTGDNLDELGVAFFYSKVYNDLYKEDATKFQRQMIPTANGGQVNATIYQGMVCSMMNASELRTGAGTAGDPYVYRSIFVRPGALTYFIQKELEVMAGPDMTTRRQLFSHGLPFGVGIYGVSWKGTPGNVEAGATDAELATAANWEVKAQDAAREVGISVLVSN